MGAQGKLTAISALCAMALCASCTPVSNDSGCAKDTDCKGARICVARVCVDPDAGGGPATSTSGGTSSGTSGGTSGTTRGTSGGFGSTGGSSGCTGDLDCPNGRVCDMAHTMCVPGCHTNGDCPLGEPCVCSGGSECQCPPDGGITDAGYDRSQCEVGTCRTDTCAHDTSLCPYNDDCAERSDGGSVCELDPRTNVLCQDCSLGGGASGDECTVADAQGADFCLINPQGSNTFCGVDCSQGQSCPSGYQCEDVVNLTQNPCTSSSQCVSSSIACTPGDGGNDCPADSQCVGSGLSGFCSGVCVASEGSGQGLCTCVTDADCPQDNCETTTATCRISQQPCVVGPSGDAFCRAFITCVDLDGTRGCFLGRNCAPKQGLHCPL